MIEWFSYWWVMMDWIERGWFVFLVLTITAILGYWWNFKGK